MNILLMYSSHRPSDGHVRRLKKLDRHILVTVARDESHAKSAATEAHVIFGHRWLRQCLPHARKLKWVQSTYGGVDRLPCAELHRRHILLTCATISANVIARHALTAAWALTRCLPEAALRQHKNIWRNDFDWLPFPKRALVLGLGSIGRALGELLHAEGITTVGARQSSESPVPGFDRVCTGQRWRSELPQTDWCFLALPNTRTTTGLFDESAINALPRHALLVNVGRASTLDTNALCRALNANRLGGAALDVVPGAPLSEDDTLWRTPRLLITPHVAAHHAERGRQMERFCEQQLESYLRGRLLRDIVDLNQAIRSAA